MVITVLTLSFKNFNWYDKGYFSVTSPPRTQGFTRMPVGTRKHYRSARCHTTTMLYHPFETVRGWQLHLLQDARPSSSVRYVTRMVTSAWLLYPLTLLCL